MTNINNMSKLKLVLLVIGTSAVTTIASMWGFSKWQNKQPVAQGFSSDKLPANYAGFNDGAGAPVDFTAASQASLPAVVHIKTKFAAKQVSNSQRSDPFFDNDFFGDFFKNFGGPQIIPEQKASGSGVIISADGYIVTNNHVIANLEGGGSQSGGDVADEIKVTLNNKKTYVAKVVGRDPSSDLAVIKIDAGNLPYLVTGNSDDVKIGQWVLAIGYPLNLETTVTAGIVSAKARSLNINNKQSKTPIESFIQTDAAVNPGNSGGALVNTSGQLIGINSAIASKTGYYSGYSYAIPVNIVKKITADIIKTGNVQRAYLGIRFPAEDVSDELKKQLGIKDGIGVFVQDVVVDGAAKAAGIKTGDYITKVNNVPVTTGPEMQEQVANFRPGDKLAIEYERDGKNYTTTATLKGNVGKIENDFTEVFNKLGADFVDADDKVKKEFDLSGGVVVKSLKENGLLKQQNPRIRAGFVIAKVNNTIVRNKKEFAEALKAAGNSAMLTGFYQGSDYIFQYGINDINGEGNGNNEDF
jgi:serine protease Do